MLDREMFLFPIVSHILIIGTIVASCFVYYNLEIVSRDKSAPFTNDDWWNFGLFFSGIMFSCYLIATYFHTALVASALIRLKGDNPTIIDGLSFATRKLPQVFSWSVVSFLFTWVRVLISRFFKNRRARSAVNNLLESGWNVLTMFVIPVMIVEKLGVYDAFQRSRELVKKTWGEAVGFEFGFYQYACLFGTTLGLLFYLGYYINETHPLLTMLIWLIATVLTAIYLVLYSALNGISKAVIYNFANGGKIPDGFNRQVLGSVISRRT